ncbi:MAG: fatty acid desaturase, partial [Actinomycetia bacterium]|nr:fatty acid desaturase [Actinomycetes bacterium]
VVYSTDSEHKLDDPASARFGENFYQFWPRTVIGSVRSAWRLEKRRYARRKKHPFRIGNDVINAWLMSAVLWAAMLARLGIGILPYLVVQAVVGLTLLEVVNYMEHYGMLRQKVGEGKRRRYERVDPSHSWNSNNIATNVLLYHLQRHSDHHANPTRRYQSLRDYEESPVLPTGYAGMIVLALVPAVWRRVMDPRVLRHFDGDLGLANVRETKRDKVMRRYPAPEQVAGGSAPSAPTTHGHAGPVGPDRAVGGHCPACGYIYDERAGAPREGLPAGTPWAVVPDSWECPDCGVREKADFVALTREQVR